MKKVPVGIMVAIAVCIFAFPFIAPYVSLAFSPFNLMDADIDGNGFVSPGEADYYGSYGEQIVTVDGRSCVEYFAYKDGLPLKTICN